MNTSRDEVQVRHWMGLADAARAVAGSQAPPPGLQMRVVPDAALIDQVRLLSSRNARPIRTGTSLVATASRTVPV
jgi:hypothetical protein